MQAMGRRLHGGHGKDAGVSLAELLVVSLVSTILLAALGTLVSSSLAATRETTTHTAATADARAAMDVVARRLRVATRPLAPAVTPPPPPAPMFVQASANAVEFYASVGPAGSTAPVAPSRVRYEYDPTRACLLETVTPPTGPVRTLCLARGSVVPRFQYFQVTKLRSSTNPSPSPASTTPLVPPEGGQLSDADADLVASVQVHLAVTDPLEPSRTLDVGTRVLLVNHHNERPAP